MDGSLGKIQNHSRSLNLISSPRRGVIIDIVLKWLREQPQQEEQEEEEEGAMTLKGGLYMCIHRCMYKGIYKLM